MIFAFTNGIDFLLVCPVGSWVFSVLIICAFLWDIIILAHHLNLEGCSVRHNIRALYHIIRFGFKWLFSPFCCRPSYLLWIESWLIMISCLFSFLTIVRGLWRIWVSVSLFAWSLVIDYTLWLSVETTIKYLEIRVLLSDIIWWACFTIVVKYRLLHNSLLLSSNILVVVRNWNFDIGIVFIFHLVDLGLFVISIWTFCHVRRNWLVELVVVIIVFHSFLFTFTVWRILTLFLLHCFNLMRFDLVPPNTLLHPHGFDHRTLMLLHEKLMTSSLLVINWLLDEIIHKLNRQICRLRYASQFSFHCCRCIRNWAQSLSSMFCLIYQILKQFLVSCCLDPLLILRYFKFLLIGLSLWELVSLVEWRNRLGSLCLAAWCESRFSASCCSSFVEPLWMPQT